MLLVIDQKALILHLQALDESARHHGWKIQRVILDPPLVALIKKNPLYAKIRGIFLCRGGHGSPMMGITMWTLKKLPVKIKECNHNKYGWAIFAMRFKGGSNWYGSNNKESAMNPVAIRFDSETRKKLFFLAKITKRSRADLVSEAVRLYVDEQIARLAARGVFIEEAAETEDQGEGQERWNIIV